MGRAKAFLVLYLCLFAVLEQFLFVSAGSPVDKRRQADSVEKSATVSQRKKSSADTTSRTLPIPIPPPHVKSVVISDEEEDDTSAAAKLPPHSRGPLPPAPSRATLSEDISEEEGADEEDAPVHPSISLSAKEFIESQRISDRERCHRAALLDHWFPPTEKKYHIRNVAGPPGAASLFTIEKLIIKKLKGRFQIQKVDPRTLQVLLFGTQGKISDYEIPSSAINKDIHGMELQIRLKNVKIRWPEKPIVSLLPMMKDLEFSEIDLDVRLQVDAKLEYVKMGSRFEWEKEKTQDRSYAYHPDSWFDVVHKFTMTGGVPVTWEKAGSAEGNVGRNLKIRYFTSDGRFPDLRMAKSPIASILQKAVSMDGFLRYYLQYYLEYYIPESLGALFSTELDDEETFENKDKIKFTVSGTLDVDDEEGKGIADVRSSINEFRFDQPIALMEKTLLKNELLGKQCTVLDSESDSCSGKWKAKFHTKTPTVSPVTERRHTDPTSEPPAVESEPTVPVEHESTGQPVDSETAVSSPSLEDVDGSYGPPIRIDETVAFKPDYDPSDPALFHSAPVPTAKRKEALLTILQNSSPISLNTRVHLRSDEPHQLMKLTVHPDTQAKIPADSFLAVVNGLLEYGEFKDETRHWILNQFAIPILKYIEVEPVAEDSSVDSTFESTDAIQKDLERFPVSPGNSPLVSVQSPIDLASDSVLDLSRSKSEPTAVIRTPAKLQITDEPEDESRMTSPPPKRGRIRADSPFMDKKLMWGGSVRLPKDAVLESEDELTDGSTPSLQSASMKITTLLEFEKGRAHAAVELHDLTLPLVSQLGKIQSGMLPEMTADGPVFDVTVDMDDEVDRHWKYGKNSMYSADTSMAFALNPKDGFIAKFSKLSPFRFPARSVNQWWMSSAIKSHSTFPHRTGESTTQFGPIQDEFSPPNRVPAILRSLSDVYTNIGLDISANLRIEQGTLRIEGRIHDFHTAIDFNRLWESAANVPDFDYGYPFKHGVVTKSNGDVRYIRLSCGRLQRFQFKMLQGKSEASPPSARTGELLTQLKNRFKSAVGSPQARILPRSEVSKEITIEPGHALEFAPASVRNGLYCASLKLGSKDQDFQLCEDSEEEIKSWVRAVHLQVRRIESAVDPFNPNDPRRASEYTLPAGLPYLPLGYKVSNMCKIQVPQSMEDELEPIPEPTDDERDNEPDMEPGVEMIPLRHPESAKTRAVRAASYSDLQRQKRSEMITSRRNTIDKIVSRPPKADKAVTLPAVSEVGIGMSDEAIPSIPRNEKEFHHVVDMHRFARNWLTADLDKKCPRWLSLEHATALRNIFQKVLSPTDPTGSGSLQRRGPASIVTAGPTVVATSSGSKKDSKTDS
eukprot:GILJ01004383.1.p1 GENE.GILJ01004383.1~~GILJ01004383.1.p1  ORF type:complete len:1399 (+),score=255.11 GILJ01004383.1:128-4198(+)